MIRRSNELDALVRGILRDIAPQMDIDALRSEDDMRTRSISTRSTS
jgi:hypothetical protein